MLSGQPEQSIEPEIGQIAFGDVGMLTQPCDLRIHRKVGSHRNVQFDSPYGFGTLLDEVVVPLAAGAARKPEAHEVPDERGPGASRLHGRYRHIRGLPALRTIERAQRSVNFRQKSTVSARPRAL